MDEILVPVSFFAMVVLIVFFTSKYKHQTKKAIIESGGNIEFPKRKFPLLEVGLTVLGIAIGLAVAVIPQSANLPDSSTGFLTGASILLFGSVGMLLSFFIRKKLEKREQ